MSDSGEFSKRQRWKAPEEDGTALVVPDLNACGELLENNRRLIAHSQRNEPWPGFARLQSKLRQELLVVAREYTSQYAEVPQNLATDDVTGLPPIFLSGHQPELFHPGVWFKNFLLDALAKNYGGVAINVIIDNDVERGGAIGVPVAKNGQPQRVLVPYDAPLSERPFEVRKFADEATWKNFPEAVQAALGPSATWRPLVHHCYAFAAAARSCSNHLGQVFAEARHRLELESGLKTWEVPLSHLCQLQPFSSFLQQLLADLPRLHEVYNGALHDFRRENRLRSHSHPAPDLEQVGDLFEVPLWMWSADNPTRRRVYARRLGSEELELTDRQGKSLVIQLNEPSSPLTWELHTGLKIRPRALITTLFLRLFACDLFIHGIGGAKYDEVTENIARQLWKVELPRHVTATATFRLPLPRHGVTKEVVSDARRQVRDWNWHAEKYLPVDEPLVAEKKRLVANSDGELSPRDRAQQLLAVNESLRTKLHSINAMSKQNALPALESLHAQDNILSSREYSFLLHSEKIISQLLDLARGKS